MTDAEALKVAIEELRHIEPNGEGEAFIFSEAAALLERLAPFVGFALEWGANSVKWDTATEPDTRRALLLEAEDICHRMDRAYRALSTEETTKP